MTRAHQRIDLRGRGIRRVAILSDTHGWVDPRILAAVTGSDLILHAGDVCGPAVLEALSGCAPRIIAVAGNNDRPGTYVTDSGREVELYEVIEVLLEDGRIGLEHGHRHDWQKPPHADLRRAHPNARLVVYGHTHGLVCDTEHEPWVVNPGAAGRVRTRGGPSWIELNIDADHWHLASDRLSEVAA